MTNVWIHAGLVVDQNTIRFYVNGERVADSEFGFFIGNSGDTIPYECQNNAACDIHTGAAILSALNNALGTITMDTDIFLGGRMDLEQDRHFKGKLAGLTLASTAMSAAEASCVFQANEDLLPRLPECAAMLSEMMLGGNFELDLSLLQGDSTQGTEDRSSKHRTIHTFGGDVVVTTTGAQFDGDGDYIAIDDFDYESDGDFTISFWITKNDCKDDQPYEYLYSHVQNTDGTHTSIEDRQNSNINIYVGCEKDGQDTIASSVDGTVVRFNLIDSAGTWVLFDFPLQAGGDFDTLTHRWIHVVMTVTRHSVKAFFDGIPTDDDSFGFPTGTACADMHIRPSCAQLIASPQYSCSTDMEILTGNDPSYRGQTLANYCQATCHQCTGTGAATGGSGGAVDSNMLSNAAYPYPSVLRNPLADFDLRSSIFLGARSDLAADRNFLGKMALLKVYSSPVNNAEASCMFHDGEEILVDVGADGGGHRRQLGGEVEEEEEEEEGLEEQTMAPAREQRRPPPLRSWMHLPYEPSVL